MDLSFWAFFFGFSAFAAQLCDSSLSKANKESISKQFSLNWIIRFQKIASVVYGKKWLSVRCFSASATLSAIAFFISLLVFGNAFDANLLPLGSFNVAIVTIISSTFILNIFIDYISLMETRWVINKANFVFTREKVFFKKLLQLTGLFVIDILFPLIAFFFLFHLVTKISVSYLTEREIVFNLYEQLKRFLLIVKVLFTGDLKSIPLTPNGVSFLCSMLITTLSTTLWFWFYLVGKMINDGTKFFLKWLMKSNSEIAKKPTQVAVLFFWLIAVFTYIIE